jgi:hypothetical protein
MIVIAAALVGAGIGAWRAKARGGGRLDMAQYAAAHGIAFALLGLFAALGIDRLL